MKYSSTVTSKGTITLPVNIRNKLGITPGKEVDISLKGDTIIVKPKGGWEEFFAAAEQMGADLKRRGIKPLSVEEEKRATEEAKTREYHKEYGFSDRG